MLVIFAESWRRCSSILASIWACVETLERFPEESERFFLWSLYYKMVMIIFPLLQGLGSPQAGIKAYVSSGWLNHHFSCAWVFDVSWGSCFFWAGVIKLPILGESNNTNLWQFWGISPMVVLNIFNFHPYLGKWSNLTSIFFRWVVQPPTSNALFGLVSYFMTPCCSGIRAALRWPMPWPSYSTSTNSLALNFP